MKLDADISASVPPCRQRRQRRLAMSALGMKVTEDR